MAKIKPTHKEPITPHSEEFEDDFKKSMVTHNINISEEQKEINELDSMLGEAEQSLKKKIFSLPKMEALVFSDPKLSAIYDEMAENGEEKYGYHYNETIQNMIFNDYVLNSPHYLQKYKNAIPKEKKRRDKSGINQLKKAGQKKMDATGTKLDKSSSKKDVDETTTAASSGAYVGPAAWSKKGDLMGNSKKDDKIRKPIANIASISESNYLTDTSGFEKYVEMLNEELDNEEVLQEKSVSKNQQQLMGMAYAYKTGKFKGEPSDKVKELANSMSKKDLEDFASTKHKGLPEKVDEEVYDKIVKIEYFDKNGQLKTVDGEEIPVNDLNAMAEKPIKLTFTDGSEERVTYEEYNQVYSHNDDNKLNINEFLNLHDTVEYLSDREGEEPFMMGDSKWQFVNARYPDGKVDIGVYKFGHDLVYDYSRWMEEYNINEYSNHVQNKNEFPEKNDYKPFSDNDIKEDMQTMIQNNGTSMSNKSQPTGDQSSEVPQGAQQTGGLQESEKLLEELNKELEAFSIHHDKLKIMDEARKTNSQIINDRVGSENQKNFKKDFKNSDTKDVINIEKELEYKDQQTDVKDPQKLGQDIEKQAIKNSEMKGDEALKNVGNSTNDKGDEIPKRNLTSDEQEEVNMYRNGQHSIVYDNEPDERFIERQKADQGEFFDIGEKQKEFKADAPTYNKDSQPVDDGIEKVQFDKNKSGWNDREGLKESMVTGRYIDVLGKRRLIEFRLNEVNEVEKLDENFMKLNFDGLGNTYLNKSINKRVVVNEAVVDAMSKHQFYTDGEKVFAMKNSAKPLNENKKQEEKSVVNEEINKMKHLLGYKPDSFVTTKNVKKNRGF